VAIDAEGDWVAELVLRACASAAAVQPWLKFWFRCRRVDRDHGLSQVYNSAGVCGACPVIAIVMVASSSGPTRIAPMRSSAAP
jgi:hypothetical protein